MFNMPNLTNFKLVYVLVFDTLNNQVILNMAHIDIYSSGYMSAILKQEVMCMLLTQNKI